MSAESKFVSDPAAAYQDLRGHITTIIREWYFWVCMVFAVFGILALVGVATGGWPIVSLAIVAIIYQLYFIRVERPPVKNRNLLRSAASLMLAFDPFDRAVMLSHAQNDFSTEGRILARVLDNYTFGKPWVNRRQGRLVSSMLTTFRKRTITCPHCGNTYDVVIDFTGSHNERLVLLCPRGDPLLITLTANTSGVTVQDYESAATMRLTNPTA